MDDNGENEERMKMGKKGEGNDDLNEKLDLDYGDETIRRGGR